MIYISILFTQRFSVAICQYSSTLKSVRLLCTVKFLIPSWTARWRARVKANMNIDFYSMIELIFDCICLATLMQASHVALKQLFIASWSVTILFSIGVIRKPDCVSCGICVFLRFPLPAFLFSTRVPTQGLIHYDGNAIRTILRADNIQWTI